MTVRTRLLVTALATLGVGLGALLALGNGLLRERVRIEASNLLRARAETELASLDIRAGRLVVREGTVNDARVDQQAWVVDGGHVLARPPSTDPALDRAAVALGTARRRVEREPVNDVRVRVEPVGRAGAVVVALSVEPLERLQKEVLLGSLVVAVLVLAGAALAIRRALDGALRPVQRMTADAAAWSSEDLDRRFGLGPPRDELTALAATLDGLLSRVAAALRHEQRFASEVAHELRTPVAGLRGRAELALASGDADEQRTALQAVVDQAVRLDDAIGALLSVARHELDPGAGSADLAALARETGVELRGAPAPPATAEGDPDVIRRALAPLVDNARRHAHQRVWLELDDGGGGRVQLHVRDDGPGVPTELGERAFDPGVRGPDAGDEGAGLGLPLARRLARSCGGDVVLGPGPGGHLVLELPRR